MYAQLLPIVNQTTIHQTHSTRSVKTYYASITSVSSLVKKTPDRDCQHISISHVIRAGVRMICNHPTETLQLNERPVTGPLYSDAAYVTWNSYRQIWRRTWETG